MGGGSLAASIHISACLEFQLSHCDIIMTSPHRVFYCVSVCILLAV